MSAKIMGRIWDLALSHDELLVLLAMADHADHEGNNVYPSVALIAWKTGYSERQVQRIVRKLRDAKLLIVTRPATPNSPYQYRINLDAGTLKPARNEAKPSDMTGCQNVTPSESHSKAPKHKRGDILTGDKMSPGDMSVTPRGDTAMSPEPSLEPSGEAPRSRARRAPRQDQIFEALAEVCKVDWTICTEPQRHQLNQTASLLRKAGQAKAQTDEQIADAIRYVATYWRKHDWRGKKGETPAPADIRTIWRAAIEARQPSASATPTPAPQPVRAATVEERRAALERARNGST